MASSNDNVSMALFCDFENVALGVRDANYEKFDIKPVLERLLLKGSIVVKKAYCDWERYKGFKAGMHEANFELIEIPHLRMSGKNSADIRMVVDALDLCYTKSHVDTFVIISGDSDFSPLVSKLRENAKKVIGVGVKQSTSDLLVANCDEFIFYDDLVRESRRQRREAQPAVKRSPEEEQARREEKDKRRNQAMEIVASTFEALMAERGDTGKIWASVLKEAIKRRKPDFSEIYYGFRTFGLLLEEARARGLLEFGRDEKSGAYVYRGSGVAAPAVAGAVEGVSEADGQQEQDKGFEPRRRNGRGGRTAAERFEERQARRQAEQAAREAGGEAQSPWYAPEPQAGEEEAVQEPASAVAQAAQVAEQPVQQEATEAADAAAQPARAKSGKNKQPARKAKADAKAKAAKQAAVQAVAEPAQAEQPAPVQPSALAERAAPAAVAEQSAESAPAGQSGSDAEAAAPAKRPAKGRQGQAGGQSKSAKPAQAKAKATGGKTDGADGERAKPAPAASAKAAAAEANGGGDSSADAAEGAKPARKPAARGARRPAKPKAKPEA